MFNDGEEDTTGGSEREDMEDIGDSPWKPLKAAAQQRRRTNTEKEKFPVSSLLVLWQDEGTF